MALSLYLECPTGRQAECAGVMRRQMAAPEWAELVELAAAVLAEQERVATGRLVLVGPADSAEVRRLLRQD